MGVLLTDITSDVSNHCTGICLMQHFIRILLYMLLIQSYYVSLCHNKSWEANSLRRVDLCEWQMKVRGLDQST